MPLARFARLTLLVAVGGACLGSAPGLARAGDCSVILGDFEKESFPVSTGSCRWSDLAPKAVVEVLSQPARWHRTFGPVLDGELLRDGRLIQVYRAKPFPERQVTIELSVTRAGKAWRVDWKKARRQAPLREGLVEIETFDGWWEVKPDGEGGSIVTHGARFNPGEGIPPALIEKGTSMQIRRLMRQLHRAVEEG